MTRIIQGMDEYIRVQQEAHRLRESGMNLAEIAHALQLRPGDVAMMLSLNADSQKEPSK